MDCSLQWNYPQISETYDLVGYVCIMTSDFCSELPQKRNAHMKFIGDFDYRCAFASYWREFYI